MRRILLAFLNRCISSKPVNNLIGEQNLVFERMGFARQDAVKLLEETKLKEAKVKEWKEHNSQPDGMASEHLVLFAAIAVREKKIKKILEIGTFQGKTTLLLSKLFPLATIETLDLSDEDIRRNKMYSYGIEHFGIEKTSSSNINFLTLNSLRLLDFSDFYDLIWVDGNHLSPYTVSDIVNSIRLLNRNGFVVCDDIYLKKPFIEKNADLSSIAIIRALAEEGIINYDLILKRLGKRFNNVLSGRKYIAIIRRRT